MRNSNLALAHESNARVRAYRRQNLPVRFRGFKQEIVTKVFPLFGLPVMCSALVATRFNPDGSVDHLGVISRRVITTVGVGAMANAYVGTFTLANFNYHDCGTGTTTDAIGDTALQTPYGGARATGTQSNPSNGVYQSVGVITFSGTFAITEFGIFSATTSGTLLDRFVFAAINVVSGASIQFTFQLTYTAGG